MQNCPTLNLLLTADRDREAALAEVRRKIQLGLDQLQRGEIFEGEAVFDELDEESGAGDGAGIASSTSDERAVRAAKVAMIVT